MHFACNGLQWEPEPRPTDVLNDDALFFFLLFSCWNAFLFLKWNLIKFCTYRFYTSHTHKGPQPSSPLNRKLNYGRVPHLNASATPTPIDQRPQTFLRQVSAQSARALFSPFSARNVLLSVSFYFESINWLYLCVRQQHLPVHFHICILLYIHMCITK